MKKFFTVIAACMAISSVTMAAPMTNLEKGESTAGYLYWNPKIEANAYGDSFDAGKTDANGFYFENAISDKIILGIETIQGDKTKNFSGVTAHADTRFTDITLQYKLDKNVRLIAGNRNYDTSGYIIDGVKTFSDDISENKFIYGMGAFAPIDDKTIAYATYLHDSYANDWQIGINHDVSKNVALSVNYRYHDEDYVTLKGIGAGLIYKF